MSKRWAILLGVLAVGAVAVPALASQTVKIDSRVTLAVGDSSGGTAWPDQLLGKDRSNNRGKWKLARPPEPGRFYAKVVRQEEGTAGTIFVCGGDRSEVAVLPH